MSRPCWRETKQFPAEITIMKRGLVSGTRADPIVFPSACVAGESRMLPSRPCYSGTVNAVERKMPPLDRFYISH